MNHFKVKIVQAVSTLVMFVLIQGCVAKKETVELMPLEDDPVTCNEMLSMDQPSVSHHDMILALDNSLSGSTFDTCWKPLMRMAVEQQWDIPLRHLGKAVHVFNRNDSKEVFFSSVYLYLKGVLNGKGQYRVKEKRLLAEYLSVTIAGAQSRQDRQLEKAKLICSRLDPKLYEKFFQMNNSQ